MPSALNITRILSGDEAATVIKSDELWSPVEILLPVNSPVAVGDLLEHGTAVWLVVEVTDEEAAVRVRVAVTP